MKEYKQCCLRKDNIFLTVWIPENLAHTSLVLKIKRNGVWDEGWAVQMVWSKRKEPIDINKAIRQHRKRTGDSEIW